MSRDSGHGLARMVLLLLMLFGKSANATHPPSGGELVPLVFEAGGRPAEETVAFVRSWAAELEDAERSKVIRHAWQQYSCTLQSGNAEMILSAIG